MAIIKIERPDNVKLSTFVFAIVFETILVLLGISLLFIDFDRKVSCTEKVKADVIDYKTDYKTSYEVGTVEYYPILQYEYDGEQYERISYLSLAKAPDIGDTYIIKINKNNPEQIYIQSYNYTIFSLLLLIPSVVFLVITIRNFITQLKRRNQT